MRLSGWKYECSGETAYAMLVDPVKAREHYECVLEKYKDNVRVYAMACYALAGNKNTSDIAGLLFLSTQTIYNCRSVTKNKAINKETFEGDVLKLCTVIGLKK